MADLLILGIYPHAVEMADIVGRINHAHPTWTLLGFVSPDGSRVGEELAGLSVISLADAMGRYASAFLIPAYEWPAKTDLPRDRLISLIDPSAVVSSTARIGLGCVLYPQCYVGAFAAIGDFLFCLAGSVINHDDVLEDRVTLTSSVTLAGEVHVESDCYFGQSSTVRELLRVGRGSLIGMGAVVLHDVAPNSVMVGNPARRLRSSAHTFPGVHLLRSAKRLARESARAARRTAHGAKLRYLGLLGVGS